MSSLVFPNSWHDNPKIKSCRINYSLSIVKMTETAERLAVAMAKRGFDQTRLARELDVTQGAISKILNGATRNSRLMPRIAAKLEVPLPWLLSESEDREDLVNDAFTAEERDWVELLRSIAPKDRAAALQLVRTIADSAHSSTVQAKKTGYRPPTNNGDRL